MSDKPRYAVDVLRALEITFFPPEWPTVMAQWADMDDAMVRALAYQAGQQSVITHIRMLLEEPENVDDGDASDTEDAGYPEEDQDGSPFHYRVLAGNGLVRG